MKALRVIIFLALFGGIGYGVWFGAYASKCPDSDGDKLNDCNELHQYHTEQFNADTDGDGYPDGEEISQGYSPHYPDGLRLDEVDSDRDGLMDSEEIELGTSLVLQDTDGDGVNDFVETHNGQDPLHEVTPQSGIEKMREAFGI